MNRVLLLTALAACIAASTVNAVPANGSDIAIGSGIAGSLSFFEAGVMLPKVNDTVCRHQAVLDELDYMGHIRQHGDV